MFSSFPRRSMFALVAAAALALASVGAPALASKPTYSSAAPRRSKLWGGLLGSILAQASAARAGKRVRLSAAQQKRISKKKRGIARNRRHHR